MSQGGSNRGSGVGAIAILIALVVGILVLLVVVVGAIVLALVATLWALSAATFDRGHARRAGTPASYPTALRSRSSTLWQVVRDPSRRRVVLAGCFAAGLLVAIPYVSLSGQSEQASAKASPNGQVSTTSSATTTQVSHHHPQHHTRKRPPFRSGGTSCHAPADVLAGVYHPARLQILAPCRVAAGTVVHVRHEPDGDLHLDLALDPAYSALIDNVNRSAQGGALLIEFMARDGGHLPPPTVGDHLRLTGAWVDDTQHGWNELHPVWSVQINGGGVHHSGPQYGGSPESDRSYNAAGDCRDQRGRSCRGYEGSSGSGSSGSGSNKESGSFCTTHTCIPSFNEGTGTIVQCADGEWSHSGGRPGVCSRHGGPKE